jgi:RNA-directed DNA polymerase
MSSLVLQAAHDLTWDGPSGIDWTACARQVRSLQRRIVKSLRAGNWRKVKRLCFLLVNSFAARALAVKRVTENSGKKTAGIDGKVWMTPDHKMQAVQDIAHWNGYRPSPLKRIYIPKKDKSQKRPLSIPVMEDRARQAVHMQALQPIAETTADGNSYGFRVKRQCADAIDQCFKVLRQKSSACWILEGDIKGFFDNIAFDWILEHIPMDRKVLGAWLRSGFIDRGKKYPTTQGVPQGGVISPVIGNMVLDGLEACVLGSKASRYRRAHNINFVRYADDFIVTASGEAVLKEEIIPKINAFLEPRGVALSAQKTKVTHIAQGFDFLGQSVRKFERRGQLGKIQITPSQSSLAAIKAKVKDICKASGGLTQAQLIDKLNPVLRGWANYHRHVICAESFSKLDSYVWGRLFRWAKRRHPDKTGKWIAERYFRSRDGYKWTFVDDASSRALIHVQQAIKQQRHIKVKAAANPFDREWEPYFRDREKLLKLKSVNEFIGKVLRRQNGECPVCRQVLERKQEHCLHHIDGDTANRRIDNVVLLHRSCQPNSQQASKATA